MSLFLFFISTHYFEESDEILVLGFFFVSREIPTFELAIFDVFSYNLKNSDLLGSQTKKIWVFENC